MIIEVLQANNITNTLQDQATALYTQLNPSISQLNLNSIVEKQGSTLIVTCRDEGVLVGLALLARYKVISGHKGMVEDVIVDSAYRGRGIGRQLMTRILEEARKDELDEVLLFTAHHRQAAKMLYISLGFQLKDSGLYSLKLT
jgi:phosphinothricin acetyltransferase